MLTQAKRATVASATDCYSRRSGRQAARIAVKTRGGILFIDSATVLGVVVEHNRVLLLCESDCHHLREPMSVMEEKLKPYGFVRIHRSVLVNKVWVDEIRLYAPRKYLLRLKNGTEFTVTRTYKGNLKLLAELWIGSSNDLLRGG